MLRSKFNPEINIKKERERQVYDIQLADFLHSNLPKPQIKLGKNTT